MRICLLYPHFFGHDGYVRDINALYAELCKDGKHQISVCPASADAGIDGRPGLDELKLVKPLLTALRDIDAVHVFGFFFPLYPLLIRLIRMSGKPYILSPLGQLETLALNISNFKKSLFIRAFGRSMLNNAAIVHAFAGSEANSIKTIANKVSVVEAPLGIYYEDVPLEIKPSRLRPAGDYFLFLGRLAYFHKGIDVLLDGYANYLAEGGSTGLVIAGRSWKGSHERIRQRIDELRITSSVHFLGEIPIDEKFALMQECKAFVYPSRHDGPPRPIRDALALHKPLLVSHQSNIVSNLESQGWGYAFNPAAEELAAAMQRMDTEYASSSYQDPQMILSWRVVASQYAAIYDSLAAYSDLQIVAA